MNTLPAENAWRLLMAAPHSRWNTDIERFEGAPLRLHHAPKFRLEPEDTFFCIGSCFARNIEEHLIYRGRRILSKRIVSPKAEAPARPNGFINKFTTMSIVNEIEWVAEPPVVDESLFEETAQGWVDLQLGPGIPAVSFERAAARRRYLTEDYFARLRQASVVIVTLGLNEVWWDERSGRYLNCAPSFASARREAGRYRLHITDVGQNVADLERMRDLLRSLSPSVRIIVTVSPVPMAETFSGIDVAVANTRSKSTLRAAAEEFASAHEDVDYFPSYEIVSLAPRNRAYAEDRLHVANGVVGAIMEFFLQIYAGIHEPGPDFVELGYLAANPDVEEAVRRGEFESGFEQWMLRGREEGRPLTPASGPTPLMIASGAI